MVSLRSGEDVERVVKRFVGLSSNLSTEGAGHEADAPVLHHLEFVCYFYDSFLAGFLSSFIVQSGGAERDHGLPFFLA